MVNTLIFLLVLFLFLALIWWGANWFFPSASRMIAAVLGVIWIIVALAKLFPGALGG